LPPRPRRPITSAATGPLTGAVHVPGDKSISHRALMLGALAIGETVIHGLLEGEDVHRTADALRAMGAAVVCDSEGVWRVQGCGVGGLHEADDVLDLGNAGTSTRLLMGIVGSHPFTTFMTGDASLRGRPMERIAAPLREIGATVVSRTGGRLPLAVIGAADPMPISYTLPMPSAQVKSAVLLAGLNAPGVTTVIEPERTRDHTELMLQHFGATVETTPDGHGGARIALTGQPELTGSTIIVPGDPSSAAFPMVAALLCPGSEIRLRNVGLNPLRTGLITTLLEMGADITRVDERREAGETVADLVVRAGVLRGVETPPERAPSMIDEYPILAMAAACAEGTTIMRGVRELRVKESDRLAVVAQGLSACGIRIEESEDELIVHGTGARGMAGAVPGGGVVETHLDHRIAMSFLMLGLAAEAPVAIDDAGPIDTSFPGFIEMMNGLGAKLSETS
jgi:3-phosphoshikimate 1-carboxyvinyltransferase